MQITPEIINTSDITIAVTGLLINVLAIILPVIYAVDAISQFQIPTRHQYPVVPLFSL